MEANKLGFTTAAYPCEGGECDEESESWQRADDDQYGSGSEFTIDTRMMFNVQTRFESLEDDDGFPTNLVRIRTTLTQDGNQIELIQENEGNLDVFADLLRENMAIIFSNYKAGDDNDISGEPCFTEVSFDGPMSMMSNFSWSMNDALVEPDVPDDTLIIDGPAENVDDCGEEFCTGCSIAYYAGDPSDVFYQCTDYTSYKYNNMCGSNRDTSLCGEADHCFFSWPADDRRKWRSENAACRPLPDRLEDGDYKFARRRCGSTKGLCVLGCDGAPCHFSWPEGENKRSPDAMCRCKN